MRKIMNKGYTFLFLLLLTAFVHAQEEVIKEKEKALKASVDLTWEANKELSENEFIKAEADYRRAISKSDENVVAPYNLGTAYYKKESLEEAFGRFKQVGELASEKPEKHKAFHNMGNVFMKNEEYDKAVEAYKEALRNDPTDEETRYNLALAKALAKKEKDQDKEGDEDKKDPKEEKEDQEEKKEDKQDQEQDNKEKDEGEQEKDDNKDGDGEEKKEQPKQGEKPDEEKQPRKNQLSPQQVKNLLEAMQNEENKVQEKMNEKKVKGPKSKNAKDW
ncbi:tetratricopeptide repeat protein [uncultured Muriicola sp.]|uniref:tetratricopeptide repeat protein n=1 Tax=uncultured Muriicola sp. TaxID=1583102 RepID=UPI0026187EFC|nr:tetratricopeptide repeat protein [uncultured Muriicola sp.]